MFFAVIIIITLLIALGCTINGLYQKNHNAYCKSKKRLDGKTTLITGGTSGIGLEIAIDFACRGAKVIIACPFTDEGLSAKKVIEEATDGNAIVIYKHLDLASLHSVRQFAADLLKTEERLDILMNNAGVGIPGDYQTDDGLNFIMQVNYFGHFLLTLLLLPLLIKTGTTNDPARIVNTSSILHKAGEVDIENMNKSGYYRSKVRIYGNSKLCLILFARELTKKLRIVNADVVINSVDPGAVGTRIFDTCGKFIGEFITFFYYYFHKTAYEGAQTAIYVALDEKARNVSGEFFENCHRCLGAKAAYNDKSAINLWEESVRLVKLTDEEMENAFKIM